MTSPKRATCAADMLMEYDKWEEYTPEKKLWLVLHVARERQEEGEDQAVWPFLEDAYYMARDLAKKAEAKAAGTPAGD